MEGKDVYNAMTVNGGYNLRTANGDVNIKKFKNALDYSLDVIKLQEVYEKVVRRKDFSFMRDDKQYTKHIITLTFNYAYKAYNQAYNGYWVKDGYNLAAVIDKIQDCVYIDNGELIAIQCHKEVENGGIEGLKDICPYFQFDNDKRVYVQNGIIPVIKDKADLRDYVYQNGFICDGIKYVRYKRSGGSSRVGKCLFINEQLASRMQKWDKCGLKIKDGDPIDLAAYEAYISLPMSSIIDTVELLPENILVIDDYDSVFNDNVIAVEVDSNSNTLVAQKKNTTVTNSIWDGQSLLDVSVFKETGYSQYGMLLLRNRFFKSACFNTNIQQWFSDNNITDVSQLKGFTMATNIKDIKLITTPNSIKYLKFGSLQQWLDNIDVTYGIVKHEKPTHYFDGRMVQTHYQLINTLPLSYSDVVKLLKPSLDYIDSVRSDPDVLRHHIQYSFNQFEYTAVHSKNDIVFKLLGINNDFAKTKLYADFKSDLVKSLLEKLRNGKLLVHGNYSTLFGNGIEMLKASIGQFDGSSELCENQIHSLNFNFGMTILGSRSPHVTMGNIALLQNVRSEIYDRYFNLSKEIVCINSIGINILQRLNGSDFDSDTVLLTDNEILLNAAKQIYDKFEVPTNEVVANKTQRYYTTDQQVDLDIKTSVNKIGEVINLSQQLNSLFWNRYAKGETLDDNLDLYCDICKLAVLSGVEIDRAKKEFVISTGQEIKLLKTKYQKEIDHQKPLFFKRITENNGYLINKNTSYLMFDTPMDYVQRVINVYTQKKKKRKPNQKINYIPFMDIVRLPSVTVESLMTHPVYYEKRDRIIDIIRETRHIIKNLYIGFSLKSPEEKKQIHNQVETETQNCIEYIEKVITSEAVMYLLLQSLSFTENKDIARFVFRILFGKPNIKFFTMINNSREPLYQLVEDKFGNIQLYDYTYLKEINK